MYDIIHFVYDISSARKAKNNIIYDIIYDIMVFSMISYMI